MLVGLCVRCNEPTNKPVSDVRDNVQRSSSNFIRRQYAEDLLGQSCNRSHRGVPSSSHMSATTYMPEEPLPSSENLWQRNSKLNMAMAKWQINLTQSSIRNARTMKRLACMCALFLPGTFYQRYSACCSSTSRWVRQPLVR